MEIIFEKDGQLKERYMSKKNNIPFDIQDARKILGELIKRKKESGLDWSKQIPPVMSEIAYFFILQIIDRPVSKSQNMPPILELLADIQKNIHSKFPELAQESRKLYQEYLQCWQSQQKMIRKKPEPIAEVAEIKKKANLQQKSKKGKTNKYKLIETTKDLRQEESQGDNLTEAELQQLLQYLEDDMSP